MYPVDQRYFSVEQQVEIACRITDEEVAANLRKYCTVLICGFVERSVEVVLLERLKNRAHPRVLNFIKSYFKRGMNFDDNAICSLLERFDPQWERNFRMQMDGKEKLKSDLASIYAVRNSVAHGGNAGINASTLRERLYSAKQIIEALIQATV